MNARGACGLGIFCVMSVGCSDSENAAGPNADPAPVEDGGEEAGMPEPSAVIEPLDVEALVSGNRADACDAETLDARVETLISSMTIEQKLFEMSGTEILPADGLYPSGGDATLGIPPFKMVDGPRGARAGTATAFPVGMARGATWDPELERRVGLAIGLEVAAKGGNVVLAPCMNLLRHPGWGRAQETYSEDPYLMGMMAVGFIGGAQNHVLASAKHFAVNSIENTRFTMSANLDERTLREVYLPHFQAAVEVAHVASVMSAYNRVNGTYCAENAHLLSDILRGDWGFAGFVESDWIAGVRSTVPSVFAGCDIEMPLPNYYGQPLVDAIASGEVPGSVIDEAVRRILRQKLCFGLDDPPTVDPSVVESGEHRELAREVARRSIVLLKNEGDVLPLSEDDVSSVAVVGDLADLANLGDRGSSMVTPTAAVSPLQGLRARLGDDRVIAVENSTPTEAEFDRIASADVAIVVVGLTFEDEGEFIPIQQEVGGLARGGDRAELGLSAERSALIRNVAARAGRTIVVLEAGSAVTVRDWVDDVDALLMAWYPGMEGGRALADIVFGDVSPSARLPVTFHRSADQLPPWDITGEEVTYEYLHGYRLFDAQDEDPEFAFGFGLGYSPTSLARPAIDREEVTRDDTVVVSVDVQNRGSRQAEEVVQVYAGARGSSIERAPRVLVGFSRATLEPGEVRTVKVAVPVMRALAHWDTVADAWAVEPGTYELYVGTSSRDLPFELALRVD